jgi:hypothetical protein
MEGIETVGRAQEGNGPVDSRGVNGVTVQTNMSALPALGRMAHCCHCSTNVNVGKASSTYSRDMIDGSCITTKLGEKWRSEIARGSRRF